METLPSEINTKILHMYACMRESYWRKIHQEMYLQKRQKDWRNIHQELINNDWFLYESSGRYTMNLGLPKEYTFADIMPCLVQNNTLYFYSGDTDLI